MKTIYNLCKSRDIAGLREHDNANECLMASLKTDFVEAITWILGHRDIDDTYISSQVLWRVCNKGYIDIASLILQNYVIDTQGMTNALNAACQHKYIDIIYLLIKNNVQVTMSSINAACVGGDLDIIKILVCECSNIDYHDAILNACFAKHVHILNWLFAKGSVDVCKHDDILDTACESGSLDIIKNIAGRYKAFPIEKALDIVCRRGYLDAFKWIFATYQVEYDADNFRVIRTLFDNNHMNILEYVMNETKYHPRVACYVYQNECYIMIHQNSYAFTEWPKMFSSGEYDIHYPTTCYFIERARYYLDNVKQRPKSAYN